MSSPAKRRKKSHNNGNTYSIRSLDYFFAKQKDKDKLNATQDSIAGAGAVSLTAEAQQSADVASAAHDLSTVDDEQLARRLQEEWNKEAGNQAEESPANASPANAPPALQKSDTRPEAEHQTQTQAIGNDIRTSAPAQKRTVCTSTLALQSTSVAEDDTTTANVPFDCDPLEFNPSDHVPKLLEQWAPQAGRASYALLTHCFVLINSTSSRIRIVATLVNLLRTIIEADPESLLPTVWLATNSISPPYIDLELGLGGSAISKALKKVCGLDNAGLKVLHNKHGDAGDVAFEAKKKQSFTLRKPKPLTIQSVFDLLVKIASSKGHGSVEAKQRIVERLVQDARGPEETRYIVRTLVQHLRIGAVKTTMLIALSRAFMLSKPRCATFDVRKTNELSKLKKEALAEMYSKSEEIIKACFARHPNYSDLVPALLEVGVCKELLVRCGLRLHIPLRPMLGSITRDLGEMITKLQGRDFSCEYKYDGQRAQVHCDETGKVTIFSRHLEVMTEKYPDLVGLVPEIRGQGVSSFILEGEVVAIDRETGELKTFQTLSNRARKDVQLGTVTIDVCLFSFDLMMLNGTELLDRSFRERRELLRSLFIEIPHHFTWVKSIDTNPSEVDAVQAFFKKATDIKCEGIMVKLLDNAPNPDLEVAPECSEEAHPMVHRTPKKSKNPREKDREKDVLKPTARRKALLATYEPDKRLDSWLKVKKDYNTAADTLDLIPIAGFHGQGRKAKFWSPILLAVRNADTGMLSAITKCMSGFTDTFYKANRERYNKEDPENTNVLPEKPHYVDYNGGGGWPDVWFEPQEVWEVAFADLTLSPTYTAAIGLVSEDRGLSTRFPRFLKVREDKSIDEATDAAELASMYSKQDAKAPTKKFPAAEDEQDDDE